ncbi:hypothetical protein MMC30_007996 [Trapelia coarctata]|nr:hypothetical protein [Trapelia coarctata]
MPSTYDTHFTDYCPSSLPSCDTHLPSAPLPTALCPSCTHLNATLQAALETDRNAPERQNPLQFQQRREIASGGNAGFPYQQSQPPNLPLSTQLYGERDAVPAAVGAAKGKRKRRSPNRGKVSVGLETVPEEEEGTGEAGGVGGLNEDVPTPVPGLTSSAKRRKRRAKAKAATAPRTAPETTVTAGDGSGEGTMGAGAWAGVEGARGNEAEGLTWLPVMTAHGMAEGEGPPRKKARKSTSAAAGRGRGCGGHAA